ncbi:MAG: hypothetical protein SFU25_08870, partial [Candidatus Caenarcaniphilales bacterium]|nr:hypothetical protein [Candidatus Caenarcaniphilales bacterium]
LIPVSGFQNPSLFNNNSYQSLGGLSSASANGVFDFRNSNNTFNIFNGPVMMGGYARPQFPMQYNTMSSFSPRWTSAHLPVASTPTYTLPSSYSHTPTYNYYQPTYSNYGMFGSSMLSSLSSSAASSGNASATSSASSMIRLSI